MITKACKRSSQKRLDLKNGYVHSGGDTDVQVMTISVTAVTLSICNASINCEKLGLILFHAERYQLQPNFSFYVNVDKLFISFHCAVVSIYKLDATGNQGISPHTIMIKFYNAIQRLLGEWVKEMCCFTVTSGINITICWIQLNRTTLKTR